MSELSPSQPVASSEDSPRLVIALSAYNGARHIAEQIESIRAQSLADWWLIVRDDGSTDDTVRIVEELSRRDDRIRFVRDQLGNLGPPASFGVLLEYALERGAAYVALSDQDDVWMPAKLEQQMELLVAHEARMGPDHAILVHSDLAVVGDNLRLIHPSFLGHQRLEHVAVGPLGRLLVQNFVTGCTVLLNRPLLQTAVPLPRVVMHDWWLAQCAAAVGSLLFLPRATVKYRQHSANAVGGRGALRLYVEAFRRPLEWWARGRRNLAASGAQACELAARLASLSGRVPIDPRLADMVTRYCAALRGKTGPFERLKEIRRLGIRPRSLLYPLFYLRILTGLSTATRAEHDLWHGGRGA